MDNETAPQPARRPRLNPFTKAERRQRILAWLRLGWTYEKIAIEEGLSARRIRQIAADTVRREGLDDPTDHALLQLDAARRRACGRRRGGQRRGHRSDRAPAQGA